MATLEVIIKTVGAGALKDLGQEFGGLTQEIFGLNAANLTAAGLLTGLVAGVKQAVNETMDYATVVRDMKRITGETAEETSRLLQVTDDLGISQNSLSIAMEAATRKGIDVSIGGLQKLADEYQKLNPGLERSKFLMDTFGRSGMDMAAVMEKGSEGIKQMAAEISQNLILTEKQIQQARNAEIAFDDLSDSMQGIKYSIGTQVIPPLTEFINTGQDVQQTIDDMNLRWMDAIPVLGGFRNAVLWANEAIQYQEPAAGKAKDALREYTASQELINKAINAGKDVEDQYSRAIEGAIGQTLRQIESDKLIAQWQDEKIKKLLEVRNAAIEAAVAVIDMGKSFKGTSQKDREEMLLEGFRGSMQIGGASQQDLVDLTEKGNLRFGLATKESQNLAKIQAEVKKELEGGAKYTGDMLNFIEKLSAASTVLAQNELWNKFKATEINSQIDMLGSPLGASNTFGSPLQTEKNQAIGTTQPADIGLASTNTQLTETNKYITNIADASGQIEKNFRSLADGLKPLLDKITKELTDANVAMQKNFFKPVNDALTLADETAKAILKDLIALKKWADENIITIRIRYSYEGASPGKRALGGDVAANKPYIVGENGPELFVPPSSGTIIPNNKISSYVDNGNSVGGGGNKSVVNYINFEFKDATLDEEQLKNAWNRIVSLS